MIFPFLLELSFHCIRVYDRQYCRQLIVLSLVHTGLFLTEKEHPINRLNWGEEGKPATLSVSFSSQSVRCVTLAAGQSTSGFPVDENRGMWNELVNRSVR